MTEAEQHLHEAASLLGELESGRAAEYLRLVKFENVKPWEASMRVDAEYALRIRLAQAQYAIAESKLRSPNARQPRG